MSAVPRSYFVFMESPFRRYVGGKDRAVGAYTAHCPGDYYVDLGSKV